MPLMVEDLQSHSSSNLLYSFEDLAEVFTSEINGLKIDVDRKTAKIYMTIPENIEIWLPDRVKKLFGIDDEGWLTEIGYIGDHSLEFSPQGISVYLKQLSTTDNFLNNEPSQFLGFIPITDAQFGEYFMVEYDKPRMNAWKNSAIHEIDFDFKIEFRDRVVKLDNHSQPLKLELVIK